MRLSLLLSFLLACSSGASPSGAASQPTSTPSAAPAAPEAGEASVALSIEERGARVFAQHCASCHGPEGRGDGPAGQALDPPAADLRGPRAPHLRGIPRRQIIEEGRPGTAMVGWKDVLSPEDLDAVYTHVHNMHHGPGGGGGRGGGRGIGR